MTPEIQFWLTLLLGIVLGRLSSGYGGNSSPVNLSFYNPMTNYNAHSDTYDESSDESSGDDADYWKRPKFGDN